MYNSVIHLDNTPFSSIENTLKGLQTKIRNVSDNLTAEYGSYTEMLKLAKEQLEKSENKSTADMTMDEYKDYINEKLQSLPRATTRYQDKENVIISDDGYQAMKDDPEYEAWVIDVVKQNLSMPNYLHGWQNSARISVHQFGASKEEYRGYSSNLQSQVKSPINNEEEDFWTLRQKRMKKLLEMEQEMFDNLYQLQQLSEHKAEIKSAQMKADGLIDTSNPMPVITGIPAKYLLSMLTADTKV